MFQETIPSISPGEELFTFLVKGQELNDSTPKNFTVRAKYEFGGKAYEQSHSINLAAYFRTSQDRNELLDAAKKSARRWRILLENDSDSSITQRPGRGASVGLTPRLLSLFASAATPPPQLP
jgi:hypothetical protein